MKTVNNIQKTLLRKQLDYKKRLLSIVSDNLAEIKELVDHWDGKVYTKRFQTQLQEISNLFYIDEFFSIIIRDYNDRDIIIDDGTYYISDTYFYIGIMNKKWTDTRPTINAEKLKESINLHLEQLLSNLEKEEQAYNRLDEIIENYNRIQTEVSTFINNTPHLFREYTKTTEFNNF